MKNVAAAVVRICFELCCLIVGETFFQPTQLSGFVLNGKVKVMLITMCSLKSVQSRDDTRERTYLRDINRAVLSWNPCLLCTWVVRMVAGRVLGSGWDREKVEPLFDVLTDVESGAFRLVLASKYSTTTKFWLFGCVLD